MYTSKFVGSTVKLTKQWPAQMFPSYLTQNRFHFYLPQTAPETEPTATARGQEELPLLADRGLLQVLR